MGSLLPAKVAPAFSVTCPIEIGGRLCDIDGTAGDWAEAAVAATSAARPRVEKGCFTNNVID
jgi:hypothetical protein